MFRKTLLPIFFLAIIFQATAQEIPVKYSVGENYNDRYKYSNLLAIDDDGNGGSVLVRSYYTGIILKPKGYLIEHYNKDLELISEYNYKLKGTRLVEGYVHNGQLYLLFLDYDYLGEAYKYTMHRSPLDAINFAKETLLSIPTQPVRNPLDKNYYNRNFSSGFTTTVLLSDDKSAFAISTHFKKGKNNQHYIHLFSASLQKLVTQDFSSAAEEKNYAFENIEVSENLQNAYLIGKAYFKKKRFGALERKFQYEMVAISKGGVKTQTFDDPGKFSEALKPTLHNNKLLCVGFYADRKDNRYNGLGYFELDPNTLAIKSKKYNPFSEQFMTDKFGKEYDKEVKNLVFKNLSFTSDNAILFNAEEYFVTSSMQSNSSGGRVRINRYHHNDIVSAKLDANGDMVWARNINKSEVTQGDGAYASYSSCTKGDNTYFFISSAAENPQQLNNERIVFKQGLSRNRNVFVILLDKKGNMSYKKIIDDKEVRLPLMVSKPLMNETEDNMLFYAKRGSKKQLVQVIIN
ncbi:hypothetical protein [Spongiimicrobium sp. 3-5]|uniref:hypothetical protein n=1 Tax=Spongiimicrobium sp. 3-5 TaxID=3332596 RepID=UPI003980E2AF